MNDAYLELSKKVGELIESQARVDRLARALADAWSNGDLSGRAGTTYDRETLVWATEHLSLIHISEPTRPY